MWRDLRRERENGDQQIQKQGGNGSGVHLVVGSGSVKELGIQPYSIKRGPKEDVRCKVFSRSSGALIYIVFQVSGRKPTN